MIRARDYMVFWIVAFVAIYVALLSLIDYACREASIIGRDPWTPSKKKSSPSSTTTTPTPSTGSPGISFFTDESVLGWRPYSGTSDAPGKVVG
jgi:hypothetical protein